eukprot:SAG11_NODE_17022_length_530_cov_3.819026_1_plen_99_part_00
MWKAIASAEAYINRDFQPDPIVSEIFPWLFSINGREHVSVPGTMYESDSDLVGDGCSRKGVFEHPMYTVYYMQGCSTVFPSRASVLHRLIFVGTDRTG